MNRWQATFWALYAIACIALATAALYATTLPKGTP